MKKIALAAALVLTASSAFAFQAAVTTNGITGTAHDIPGAASTGQKCVFCHTPHNPRVAAPLWNRNAMNGGSAITTVYNSPSLTAAGKGASIGVDSVSGFCMSCHDGVTAMGDVKNKATVGNTAIENVAANRLGVLSSLNTSTVAAFTDMTMQHPVGFSYVDAQAEDAAAASGPRLWTTAEVASKMGAVNAPFFGAAGDQMECASCQVGS